MSFLKRLKDRRNRGQAAPPAPSPAPLQQEQEARLGPLADFLPGSRGQHLQGVDLGLAQGSWATYRQRSRLSKTTREVLHDHSALGYLIQYLEARDAVQLVKFWLDVESYRASASTFITSSYVPPQVSRERLDMVPECQELQDYDEAEILCGEAREEGREVGRTRLPDTSASTESFDSGVESRSDGTSISTSTHEGACSPTSTQSQEGPSSPTTSCPPPPPAASLSPPPDSAPARGRAEQLLQTRAEDAVKIYRRYIAPECTRPVHLPTDTKRGIVESICAEGGQVAADCFDLAQESVVQSLETEYFPDFLTSQYHAKHQVDVLTSGDVLLTDILYNDTALFHFTEYLESRAQRTVIEFWLAATNFSQSGGETRQCQEDAMVLYDKFLSMQATTPLGLPSSLRLQVEDAICSPDGPDCTCFHLPLQVVGQYLEQRYLQPFLLSPLYSNYVKELIATIQASPRSLSGVQASIYSSRSCRTESDTRSSCSSEFSSEAARPLPRSSSNTLLASSSGRERIKEGVLDWEDQDPDTLWRRRPVRNKVGRVNSFGRYEPGLDLAPDMNRNEGTKKSSRLGRAMKNLVTNDEKEKMKEELAWQVAEMIVRDVTSVTMPDRVWRSSAVLGEAREEGGRELGREEGGRGIRKSRSENFSLKELSMELPTAKYF